MICSLGSFRRQGADINFTKRDLLSQNVTSHWQTFLNCKLVLYIYINTITVNIGGQMCHIYGTQPGSVCPPSARATGVLLETYCTCCHFVRNNHPLYKYPGPVYPQTQPVLPAPHVAGLNTRVQDYSSNVASFQRALLRSDLCLVPCWRVQWHSCDWFSHLILQ